VLHVVRYAMTPGSEARVAEVYPRHRAYLDGFAARGEVLLIGPLLPAPGAGALCVFRTRAAAEAFPQGDPFVLEGLAEPSPAQDWQALEFLGAPDLHGT
jgi:uncharacterized protein